MLENDDYFFQIMSLEEPWGSYSKEGFFTQVESLRANESSSREIKKNNLD